MDLPPFLAGVLCTAAARGRGTPLGLVAAAAGHDPGRIRETVEDGSRLARRPSFSALDNAVLRELGHRPLRHHAEAATEAVGRALAARSD